MHNTIRHKFDRSSITYRANAPVQDHVAAKCAMRVPKGFSGNILEIGAGGGLLSEKVLARISPASHYYALDISKAMLNIIKNPGMQSDIFPGIEKVQADGEYPPFQDCSLDLMLSSSTMQWYKNSPASMTRNLQLLKPGGLFSLGLFVQGTFKEMEHVSSLTGFGSTHILPVASECLSALQKEKLELASEIETKTIQYDSVLSFLKKHKQTGATFSGKKARFGRERLRKFIAAYEEHYEKDGKIQVSYQILYIWGRKLL
ncbi:methyltransferase domain-containing protein [Desulfonatronovibrio magnus]|uniref:methyltransferase domain-containing protein n=1 Tax=Desulfonatronovibrio magnus TaxID=698827 RepID=UPI0005EAFE6A|nr:methyltransferase domain-containing protein [Desulfonatronovibrio magnus]RQD55534.1 MAG: SAM-dependent methyltransferase [Desulfonatronovibrio sp. MSAO_Bac4]